MPSRMEGYVKEQPARLRDLAGSGHFEAAAQRVGASLPRRVFLVGSGTSAFAGEVSLPIWREGLGIETMAVTTLTFLHDHAPGRVDAGDLIIGVSQSGSTTGLVDGLELARSKGCLTVAVTADPGSALARAAEITVDSRTGPEDVFAKTKGFTTTALAACLFAAAVGRSSGALAAETLAAIRASLELLPEAAERVIASAFAGASGWAARLATVDALAVIGSPGAQLTAAREGALKLLEVGKLLVAAYELEESLHGPFNAFGPRLGLVLLGARPEMGEKVAAFERGAASIDAPLVTVLEEGLGAEGGPADLVIPRLPYEPLSALLGVLPLQVLAAELARVRGVDPDRTRYPHLYEVFRTKLQHARAKEVDNEPTPPSQS